MSQNLADSATDLKGLATEFFTKHSKLRLRAELDDFAVINPYGNHYWEVLSVEGKRIQSRLMDEYKHYRELVAVIVRKLPGDAAASFKESDELISHAICQDRAQWNDTTFKVAEETSNAIDKLLELIEHVHSSENENIVIPDTNALLLSPRLEDWVFDWTERFRVILTPTVLSELDSLKISHRIEDVRNKAMSLIRTIKEYARRGDLSKGVSIRTGRISLQAIAVEPDFKNSLPWLDANNMDDRIIASTLEIICDNVRSVAVLVTADINLMNKALFSRIPVIDPPNQSSGS